MKVKLIGDFHGNLDGELEKRKKLFSPNAIQLGDLDLYGYEKWAFDDGARRYFIDGNHDNFKKINPEQESPIEVVSGLVYIPRAFVSDKTMFFGGEDSIDQNMRKIYDYTWGTKSWFYQETISDEDLEKAYNNSNEIEVMLAHGVPDFLVQELYSQGRLNFCRPSESSKKLSRLFARKMPKLWVAGHYHFSFEIDLYGCKFVILGIEECREFDIPVNLDNLC